MFLPAKSWSVLFDLVSSVLPLKFLFFHCRSKTGRQRLWSDLMNYIFLGFSFSFETSLLMQFVYFLCMLQFFSHFSPLELLRSWRRFSTVFVFRFEEISALTLRNLMKLKVDSAFSFSQKVWIDIILWVSWKRVLL